MKIIQRIKRRIIIKINYCYKQHLIEFVISAMFFHRRVWKYMLQIVPKNSLPSRILARKSTGVANKPDNDDLIKNIDIMLKANHHFDSERWTILKQFVLDKEQTRKRSTFNAKNFDALLLGYLTKKNYFEHAESFLSTLHENGNSHHIGVTNAVLSMYYAKKDAKLLTEIDRQNILKIYDTLKSKYKVLDTRTSENLINALAMIGKWKACVEILDEMKTLYIPSALTYNAVISTLFNHDEEQLAYQIISEAIGNKRIVLHDAFYSWIKYCERHYPRRSVELLSKLEEVFMLLLSRNLKINEPTATAICESFLERLEWQGALTTVNEKGKCQLCGNHLKKYNLTHEEFLELQKNFQKKVFIGKDPFLKSTPKELMQFQQFVEKTAPYDIVLDALNIAYSHGRETPKGRITTLVSIVNYFLKQNKKILVLGRQHMKRWPAKEMAYIQNATSVFLTQDMSQDDAFFLYAAFKSGPKTDIVSRDMLRNHRFVLHDAKLNQLFLRWQWEHQWFIDIDSKNNMKKQKLAYTPLPQKNVGWHVPYETVEKLEFEINPSLQPPSNWLCLMPKPKT